MDRGRLFSIILLVAVSLWMTGCKGDPTSPFETDEEAIEALITGSEWFNADDHFEGGADSSSINLSPIIPFAWGRQRTQPIERTIIINQVGDSAYVTVDGNIKGVLHVWAFPADTDTVMYLQKPLEVDYMRTAIFRKTGTDGDDYRGWVLEKISGADGVSTPTNTVSIDSVSLQGSSVDTVLTNPGALFDLDNALTFSSGDTINIKVYTNDNSALVFLHPYMFFRYRLQNNGDGSYSGIGIIPSPGFYRVAFDVIEWETIYDDTYPHDSNIWVYPYLVE
jgi:hypothetical protein